MVFRPIAELIPYRGEVWTGELPGIPDCSQVEFADVPAIFPVSHGEPSNDVDHKYGVHTDFFVMEQQLQQLSNYMMVSIGIVRTQQIHAQLMQLLSLQVRQSPHQHQLFHRVSQ